MSTLRVAPSGVDPVASLEPSQIEVALGGRLFTIPAFPAVDWLKILLDEQVISQRILPGMLPEEEQDALDRLMAYEGLPEQEVANAALDVLTVASGRAWWTAVRICATARASWDRVGGALWASGVLPAQLSLSAWIDAAFWHMLNMVDPAKVSEFSMQMTVPPAGWSEEYDEAAEEANFMAMLGQAM